MSELNTAKLPNPMRGECLCGSVSYTITSLPFNGCYCHCSICRKLTGSSFGAYGTVPRVDFSWVTDQDHLRVYQQNKHLERLFCSQCGSFVAGNHALDPGNIFLSLGCLQGAGEVNIEYQQFVASKASWVRINPDIPAHEAWPEWVIEKVKHLNLKPQA